MAGTTINPYRFGGQLGYRRDGTNRQYVGERPLDTSRGRWLTPDPLGLTEDENLYRYALNSPTNNTSPSGFAPQQYGGSRHLHRKHQKREHLKRILTPNCPQGYGIPSDGDYAIACSKYASDHISASFTLPALCNVKDTFINFYLSMGGFEGGVSFSPKNNGWNAFYNAQGSQQDVQIQLEPGQTVNMSLTRKKSGVVQFVIDGHGLNSPGRLSKLVQVRLVNASSTDTKCPNIHSTAAWSGISVSGGMQAGAVSQGGEEITSNLFSSELGKATLPCNSSQYRK